MNRQEKQKLVEALKQDFNASQATFVVQMQGLTVDQVQQLRRKVRAQGGSVNVIKNTLSKIATTEIEGLAGLHPYMKNQVAIVFANQDSAGVAKALCSYEKDHEKMKIVAGCLERRVIDPQMIKFLGSLPPREVILAQVCGTLKAPITAHVSVLSQLMTRLVYVIKQASEKQQ